MNDLIREILETVSERGRKYKRDIVIMVPSGFLFESFKRVFYSMFGCYGYEDEKLCLDIPLSNKNHLCLIEGKISGQAMLHFDTLVIVNSENIPLDVINEALYIPSNVNGKIPTLERITVYFEASNV